ncbi:MAG: amphi-Trp domain-containing protein [Alphaproteobacteria bacterium RIFCSPHIGHO2_12_FULL_63_12]|nr:MAG: amphi-Trp domain-containing protein [Alphaproteobacteria bacterium RIFCSPHIGHO2_12_FULL_63_12]
MPGKPRRDIEKDYSAKQFAAKLRRFADCVETGEPFAIQIAGERIRVPKGARFNIEHERDDAGEEIEFQIKWVSES